MSYLATEKLDLDQILVLDKAIKSDLDNIDAQQLLQTSPYFQILGQCTRPSNAIPYGVNQSFGSGIFNLYFGTQNANKFVQITEANLIDDNTNPTLIIPNLYLTNQQTLLFWVDQTVPNSSFISNQSLENIEIINGLTMVKVPGNINNVNVLKSTILNLNIIMQIDTNGNLYWGVTSTNIFTPVANETINLVIKGKFL